MAEPRAFELMQHQEEGIAFLLARGSGLLGFEQGLGKTLVAIEAFRQLQSRGKADLMFVICPNSLKRNWAQEIYQFYPAMKSQIISGTRAERREQLGRTRAAIVIMNYEAARVEITAIRSLLSRRKGVLVLDESHMAKNRQSLTSIAVRHFGCLAAYRWLLTGTPVTNSAKDIYSQIELVAGMSPLGSYGAFCVRYDDSDAAGHAALAEQLLPFLLRRRKEDCLDLPSKSFLDLHIPLPTWQRKLYDAARDGIVRDVAGMSAAEYRAGAGTALTRLLRLTQIASNPSLIAPSEERTPAKFGELDLLLEELVEKNARKVIIWSYYVETIKRLLHRYGRYGAVGLFGEVPAVERQQIANRFQGNSEIRVLVANPAAAGTGFTLTAAAYAIYETLNWRYDLYAQSQDRNHRIGQSVPVTYFRLLAEDTIDEVIAAALARKATISKLVLGDAVSAMDLAALSQDEFCEMVQFNRYPRAWA